MFDPRNFVDLNKNYDTAESFLSWLFANHEELRNLGLLAAAGFGLMLLGWRAWSQDRSSKAAREQAENASKSHVADTYTKAIEQLGAVDSKGEPNLELRLGGLYALEKIALANSDYHPQIMEVLCAYIRMHCPNDFDSEEDDSEPNFEPLSIDIQACLTVIGRRNASQDRGQLVLYDVDINGANLSRANLRNASFFKANLKSVILVEANLSDAKLRKANLAEANLNNTNLECTDLIEANLRGAHLICAKLYKAALCKANLNKATLIQTDFLATDLSRSDLSGANLSFAKNLTCNQINSAKIDRETKLPDYIKVTWAEDGTPSCKMVEDSN